MMSSAPFWDFLTSIFYTFLRFFTVQIYTFLRFLHKFWRKTFLMNIRIPTATQQTQKRSCQFFGTTSFLSLFYNELASVCYVCSRFQHVNQRCISYQLSVPLWIPDTVARTYYHHANSANTRLTLLVLTIKVSCKAEDRWYHPLLYSQLHAKR